MANPFPVSYWVRVQEVTPPGAMRPLELVDSAKRRKKRGNLAYARGKYEEAGELYMSALKMLHACNKINNESNNEINNESNCIGGSSIMGRLVPQANLPLVSAGHPISMAGEVGGVLSGRLLEGVLEGQRLRGIEDGVQAAWLAEEKACLLNGAACLQRLGRYAEAEAACTLVLGRAPGHAKGLFRRAQARISLGNIDAARHDLEAIRVEGKEGVARAVEQALGQLTGAVEGS